MKLEQFIPNSSRPPLRGQRTDPSLYTGSEVGPIELPERKMAQAFRLMIDSVTDYGIFLLDPDGCIVNWNKGAALIKGYSAEEIIGEHFSIFYPQEALDRDWPAYELKVARADGRFEDEGWRLRKDGSRFWANVVITSLYDEDNELLGFTKVTRDLTERREQEEALRESQRRLAEANAELGLKNRELEEFARVASHDLQEPLRKIASFSGLLMDEYGDALDGEAIMFLERISDAVGRMSSLVDDLLTYSRIEGRIQLRTEVNLNDILYDVEGDLQIRLRETDGRIDRTELPALQADPTQMRQLFQNLIGNSLKFHRPNVPPVVRLHSEEIKKSDGRTICRVEVSDNGIGFEEKDIKNIFAPFHRLHGHGRFEGSGLGLAICKRIVERHHGAIAVRSRPGEGTVFTISLPCSQAELEAEAA